FSKLSSVSPLGSTLCDPLLFIDSSPVSPALLLSLIYRLFFISYTSKWQKCCHLYKNVKMSLQNNKKSTGSGSMWLSGHFFPYTKPWGDVSFFKGSVPSSIWYRFSRALQILGYWKPNPWFSIFLLPTRWLSSRSWDICPKIIFRTNLGILGSQRGRSSTRASSLVILELVTGLGATALYTPSRLFSTRKTNIWARSPIWIQDCHWFPLPKGAPIKFLVERAIFGRAPPCRESTIPILNLATATPKDPKLSAAASHCWMTSPKKPPEISFSSSS